MKSTSKPKKKKISSTKLLDLCPYYIKPGYFKNKYYYKHLDYTGENF